MMVGPSVQREFGILDARAGKPKLSRDPDYIIGYELAQRLLIKDGEEKWDPYYEGYAG